MERRRALHSTNAAGSTKPKPRNFLRRESKHGVSRIVTESGTENHDRR